MIAIPFTRSVFGRVFIGTALAVLVALTLVALALPNLIESALLAAVEGQMLRRGYQAQPVMAAYLQGRLDESSAQAFLDGLAAPEDGEAWLVDAAGRTVLDSASGSSGAAPSPGRGMGRGGWRQRGARLQTAEEHCVLAGTAWSARGDAEPGPDAVVSVGVPVRAEGDSGTVLGGLYFNTPVADVFATAGRLQDYFLVAGGGGLLVSLGLAAVLSRRIARPVKTMTAMAGRMAGGDFAARAPVGDDEVGRLGRSLNAMAASLGASRDQAERMERLRRELVANLSHDLRSPVTAIRGYVEALLDGTVTDDAARRTYLEIMRSETESLSGLLGDLLELSRLDAGAAALRTEWVDVGALVRELGSRYQGRATESGLSLTLRVGDHLPGLVGDEARIRRAVGNLLDNALKFTPPGGRVEVEAERTPAGSVRITVSDTGPGVASEDQPHIWERFYKADKARTRGQEGSGLGLAIVRQVAEAHGGTATVHNRLEQGACFVIELPVAHADGKGSECGHTGDTGPG